ncbi:TRIC cation channel family protein [Kribbella sp. NPDC056861]|uniref:trimeric intracellular cation channel family protein n=1 Tax=Kribbella sp. NPDC056861 TaxID=3154857 RepID=UPI003435D058
MSITPFQVTLWIELLAAGLGGLQGALFAARSRSDHSAGGDNAAAAETGGGTNASTDAGASADVDAAASASTGAGASPSTGAGSTASTSASASPGTGPGASASPGTGAGASASPSTSAGADASPSATATASANAGASDPTSGRIDVLGVIAIGLAVSLGGGLLRDLVLNQPPVVVWSNWYLLTAGTSAILGMVLQPALARADWLITVLDAVVMGLFAAIGASKALSLGVGVAGALVVGVIGAIGGGMLRDVMLSLPFSFLHVSTLYAVAAGAGTAVLILLAGLGVPIPIAGLACVLVTTLIRLAAVRFDWTFPEQFAVRPRRPRHQS